MKLSDIKTEQVFNPPRMVLVGVEKVGKSTFAAGAKNPIFCPIKGEEGIDFLNVPKFPTITSYKELCQSVKTLLDEKHDYKTLVIDSISALEPLIWQYVCEKEGADSIEKVGGGYGKGYTAACDVWRALMDFLDKLRIEKKMTILLIGHVIVKSFTDPINNNYDQYIIDINVNEQTKALYKSKEGGNEWKNLDDAQANKQVLTEM